MQEIYDLLTEIWGGSPATTSLSFGIDGETVEDGDDSSEMNDEDMYRPCSVYHAAKKLCPMDKIFCFGLI